jgi:peptide/nickel transport system substrate-binding protein
MMKKVFSKIGMPFQVLFVLLFIFQISSALSAEKVQYGGTLTYLDQSPSINALSWDNIDIVWKHNQDNGFFKECLMMGDLQKGPRGTKKYSFQAGGWIPSDVLRGELAERWEVKKDPLRIIFYLRKGVYWQEKPGVMKARELTADDIIYSQKRVATSPKDWGRYSYVDRWEAPDKYTVIMYLKEWNAEWAYRMAWGYYDAIQAPEQEKAPGGAAKWQNVCGTGPYMLTEYKEGHSQTYGKNPNYWDSETIGGMKYKLPFTDKVVMMIIKDESTQLASLTTGKVDLMMAINWKHVSNLKKTNPQLQWARYLAGGNYTMAMRMDQKPFNDIRVRRAMNMAVNRQEIIDSFYNGNAVLHTYPFPPTFGDVYTPLDKLPSAARELFTYNPEKAKKILAEAGYPNGFTFKAQISNSSQTGMDLAAMVVAYLSRIGVTLVLEPMDYPSWLSRMTKKNHSEGTFFDNDHGTPYAGIRKNFVTGERWNPHMMSDPYMDKTHSEAMEDPKLTENQRMAIMKKLAVYALEQAPAIILPTSYVYAAWWPWVKNYYGEQRVGGQRSAPILARIWIDQELKKKMGY